MEKIGIIIEETTAGLTFKYVSPHLDINSSEVRTAITDERTLATQISNSSDVYSVQVTEYYKVYSLIVTDLTDFLGRAGYYAIRLFCPRQSSLINVQATLNEIKEAYKHFNEPDYESILSSILLNGQQGKTFLNLQSSVNCYCLYNSESESLSELFNIRSVYLVNKLYAFNEERLINTSILDSTELKNFSHLNDNFREIEIDNSHNILKTLLINNQALKFDPHREKLFILCKIEDTVTFNTLEDKKFQLISGSYKNIEKKIIIKKLSVPSHSDSREPKIPGSIFYVIAALLIIIGFGLWYLWPQETPYQSNNPAVKMVKLTNPDTVIAAKKFNFKKDTSHINEVLYVAESGPYKMYMFKKDGKEWVYTSDTSTGLYLKFYREVFDSLIKKSDRRDFLKELESVSAGSFELGIKPKEKTMQKKAEPVTQKPALSVPKNKESKPDNKKTTDPKIKGGLI